MGSEYFKVCMTLPHQSKFHMVENLQSKIKTHSAIFLKNTDRIYENEAVNKQIKNPKNSFSFLSTYLTMTKNSTDFLEKYYEKYFYNYDYEFDNKTNTINFKIKFVNEEEQIKEIDLPLEALYAMLFRYIKKMSEKYYKENFNENSDNRFYSSNTKIDYCFVTVPAFYNYKQRLSIIHAVSLSNMELVGITNDNTAAALYYYKRNFNINNFKINNKNENSTVNFVYINIGSSYTQLSLINYSQKEMKILGEVYDKDLGGHLFTRNLVLKIIEKFNLKKDIITYNKIYSYADKYKQTLSSNKETHISFVLDNKNYNGIITRDEFNEINKNDYNKITKLLDELFIKTNTTLKNITQYELIGGSIRIPQIQNIIKDYVGEEIENDLVGTHLNGDDSIAFGAVYAIRWRKKPIGDGNQYNISMNIFSGNKSVLNNTLIFEKGTSYETDKKFSIIFDKNFKVNLYENEKILFSCVFNNVENDIKSFKENYIKNKNATYSKIPKINFEFYFSKLGKISLNVNLVFNVRTYIGLNTTNNANNFIYSVDYIPPLSKKEITELNNKLNDTNLTYIEKELISKKLRIGTFMDNDIPKKLDFNIIDYSPKSFTEEDIKFWKKKLDFYDKRELEEIKILELRNELESLIYAKQNFLEGSQVKIFTKDDEYHDLESMVKETKEWFEDEGSFTRNISILGEKIENMQKKFEKITKRIDEKQKRDIAFEKFSVEIKNNQKNFEKNLKINKPWTEYFYDDVYVPEVKRISDYLNEKYEKQSKLKAYEDPILFTDEIEEAHKKVIDLFEKLQNIPVPIHKPKYENIKLQDLYRHNGWF